MIRLEGVAKSFGGIQAVADVSLEIEAGEFFALLGPSGCGKTTLLRLIGGFELPDRGSVHIDGEDMSSVPPWKRPVNTVFQSYALFPHMTVAQNIAFGLRQDKLPRREIRERVAEMLELVRLADFARRKPAQLSGGQRQRVALARSLAKRPKALLLDEPLAALDRMLRDEMRAELAALQRRLGLAFIFVTHDQDEAMSLASRLAVMREGRIEQTGAPSDVYERPASRYVADFLGRANVLTGRFVGQEGAFAVVEAAGLRLRVPHRDAFLAPGAEVWVAVRPENVVLNAGPQANLPAGTVRAVSYVGDASRYDIELAQGLRLRTTLAHGHRRGVVRPQIGDRVNIFWPPEAGVLLTR